MARVFLVTGTSTGFGRELVKTIIAKGDRVVATARDSSKLSFDGTSSANYLAIDLDVTKPESIDAAFTKALNHFKRIDVVVNNAGAALSGAFETISDRQIRAQLEVNFFGLLNVTRRALEIMRDKNKPQGGVIQQITSIGGQCGIPGFSIYNASKWAVEGFSEALSREIKPEWNIHIQCIEPGNFRTELAGAGLQFGEVKNPAYDHTDPRCQAQQIHGSQQGDPAKGAAAMYELATMADPPLRCILGSDAWAMMQGKMDTYRKELDKYEKLIKSTELDGYGQ